MGDFNVQSLSNTAWAFATASQQDAQLFAALARAAELRLGDFKVQDLANTAWACATADQKDALLFAALAITAERRMYGFNLQDLANTAWAFATASQQVAQLFEALAGVAELRLGNFKVQELANTAWAFAMARLCTSKLAMCSSAAVTSVAKSDASCWSAVANAHAVLARFYTLKLPRRRSAVLANAANSCASD